jgi:hypothetical protein
MSKPVVNLSTLHKRGEVIQSGKTKLFDSLAEELKKEYTFNRPTKEKAEEIDQLRWQSDMEESEISVKYAKELEELYLRTMREEIKILRRIIN